MLILNQYEISAIKWRKQMSNLKKKTFLILFGLISTFLLIFTLAYNIQSYRKETKGLTNVLNKVSNIGFYKNNSLENDFNNRYIIDYDIYTFLLNNNNSVIAKIGSTTNSDKILKNAQKILKKERPNGIKISNLYLGKMSYKLQNGNYLILIDTSIIQTRLLRNVLLSLLLLFIMEIITFITTKRITEWLTKPVIDSFNKQKEFIANASHELKTPLAIIVASTDSLVVTKKNEKYINNLKNETERMNLLLTRLLDLSQSENSNVEHYTVENISNLIEKSALTFESLAFEKQLIIKTDIAPDVTLNCNKLAINELLSILLDNAIKHGQEKSIITINLKQQKNNIKLEVINEGEAIPDSEKNKIFERFYRVDKSHNRSDNRYGLGLSIAKNIVENHNGEIKAFSKNGFTTFQINFKIKRII